MKVVKGTFNEEKALEGASSKCEKYCDISLIASLVAAPVFTAGGNVRVRGDVIFASDICCRMFSYRSITHRLVQLDLDTGHRGTDSKHCTLIAAVKRKDDLY